jgi:multiple sugar transport system substrate-binding protein
MDNQFPLPGPSASPETTSAPLPVPEEASPPLPGYQPPSAQEAPVIKPSPLKLFIPIGIGIVIVGLLIFLISRIISSLQPKEGRVTSGQPVTLTYWGLWEPSQVMKPLIDEFEKQYPKIKIDYQLQSPQDYQTRLGTALEGTNPPDIARLHTTWLPIFANSLLPAPANTISATEMSTNFYPIVNRLLVVNNQVYGIPLTAESLALFINTTMFQQKSLQPPKTWEDLDTSARILKDVDPLTGKITRAGVALGNTTNVDHWPDIVTLMLFQSGVNLYSPKGDELETTLRYYTQFVTKDHVWDDTLPNSTVAFANEKVAMIFAPSWRAREIKEINPSLAWKVVPIPQLPDSDVVNWASVWFEGVPKNSKHPKEAWAFLNFLASAQAQQLLFESAAKDREFPQPPANKAVAVVAQNNPVLAPFVTGLETAKSFYTASSTQDSPNGLNSRLIKYLEDAVNGFARGQSGNQTLDTLNSGFAQVLSQYGISSSPRTTP